MKCHRPFSRVCVQFDRSRRRNVTAALNSIHKATANTRTHCIVVGFCIKIIDKKPEKIVLKMSEYVVERILKKELRNGKVYIKKIHLV